MTASHTSDGVEAPWYEAVPEFDAIGVHAFTTTRAAGSFAVGSDEPVRNVMGRWDRLRQALSPHGPRLATAHQVHGARIFEHGTGWEGWLRCGDGDGHFAMARGTGMAVSIADCVPVFIAHASGAIALLHSGWRGTAARIIERAIDIFAARGMPSSELTVHLGPAICGACYEVSAEVYARVTGHASDGPMPVDLRAVITEQAHVAGVRRISATTRCTRCDNDRFYSHRAGDNGRQLGVMIATL